MHYARVTTLPEEAMKSDKTAVERAFELALSGEFRLVSDLKRKLYLEGYSTDQIVGRVMVGQLRTLMDKNFHSAHG